MHAPLTYEWAWHSVMGGGFVGLPRKWQMHAATRYELCPFWLQIHQRFIPTNPLWIHLSALIVRFKHFGMFWAAELVFTFAPTSHSGGKGIKVETKMALALS